MEETQGIIYCMYRILSLRILKPREGRRAAHSHTARGGKVGAGAHSSTRPPPPPAREQAFITMHTAWVCGCVGVKAGEAGERQRLR